MLNRKFVHLALCVCTLSAIVPSSASQDADAVSLTAIQHDLDQGKFIDALAKWKNVASSLNSDEAGITLACIGLGMKDRDLGLAGIGMFANASSTQQGAAALKSLLALPLLPERKNDLAACGVLLKKAEKAVKAGDLRTARLLSRECRVKLGPIIADALAASPEVAQVAGLIAYLDNDPALAAYSYCVLRDLRPDFDSAADLADLMRQLRSMPIDRELESYSPAARFEAAKAFVASPIVSRQLAIWPVQLAPGVKATPEVTRSRFEAIVANVAAPTTKVVSAVRVSAQVGERLSESADPGLIARQLQALGVSYAVVCTVAQIKTNQTTGDAYGTPVTIVRLAATVDVDVIDSRGHVIKSASFEGESSKVLDGVRNDDEARKLSDEAVANAMRNVEQRADLFGGELARGK